MRIIVATCAVYSWEAESNDTFPNPDWQDSDRTQADNRVLLIIYTLKWQQGILGAVREIAVSNEVRVARLFVINAIERAVADANSLGYHTADTSFFSIISGLEHVSATTGYNWGCFPPISHNAFNTHLQPGLFQCCCHYFVYNCIVTTALCLGESLHVCGVFLHIGNNKNRVELLSYATLSTN